MSILPLASAVKTEDDNYGESQVKREQSVEVIDAVCVKSENPVSFQPSPSSSSSSSRLLTSLSDILAELKQENVIPSPESSRKPKLKSRPPNGTVLNISNLDLNQPLEDQIVLEDLSFLHYALKYSKKMVMVTGAGISVQSGIPDFRSSNGLFQGLATKTTGSGKNLFDYNILRSDEGVDKFEDMIENLYYMSQSSKPSPYHLMMDQIAKQNRLLRLYTQNIDCLDVELPNLETQIPLNNKKNNTPQSIQLHGSIKLLNCSKCNYITQLNESFFKNRFLGDRKLIRPCPSCEEMNAVRLIAGKRTQSNGVLRPRIVLYNEFHPDGDIIGSITERDLKNRPDCLIVTGTSLKIPGVRRLVKEMAKVVHSRNGYVIWMNLDPPSQSIVDYVEHFDLIIVGDCQAVPGLVKLYDLVYSIKPKKRQPKIKVDDDLNNVKRQKV